MNAISFESKDKASVKLNNKIYPLKYIRIAANKFKHLCSVDFDNDKVIIKTLTDIGIKTVVSEFYNYVLAIMKNKGIG